MPILDQLFGSGVAGAVSFAGSAATDRLAARSRARKGSFMGIEVIHLAQPEVSSQA